MTKFRLAGAMGMCVLMACLTARAAAPELPPDAVGTDTSVVVHLNPAQFTPANLRSAMQAVMGPNAQQLEPNIAKFEAAYKKAQDAGVESMTLVFTPAASAAEPPAAGAAQPPPAKNGPQGLVYMKLKSGADPAAVEQAVKSDMSDEQKNATDFKSAGKYLILRDKGQPIPTKSDDARARQFADALGTVADAAIQIAFIPNAQTKKEMIQEANAGNPPPAVKDAIPLVANSKWVTIAAALGNAPSLKITANAADANSATRLSQDINNALAQLKQFAGQAAQGQGGPGAAMAAMVANLAQGIAPAQNGNEVSIAIQGPTLGRIANMGFMFYALQHRPSGGGFGPPPGGGRPAPGGAGQQPGQGPNPGSPSGQ